MDGTCRSVIIYKLIVIMLLLVILRNNTNSRNWYTYVTWRGNEYELPEDDTIVSKNVGAWKFNKFIVIVLLLVILQNKKKSA